MSREFDSWRLHLAALSNGIERYIFDSTKNALNSKEPRKTSISTSTSTHKIAHMVNSFSRILSFRSISASEQANAASSKTALAAILFERHSKNKIDRE